ncbi:MAG TPA: hypothetical protein DE315_06515 [Candidatus Omnitrophica bacterium]|nr:MAG: hypothetical protein A2Y05_04235 [Omnitrophica WOR_2 bacterium GWA2_53_43]HBO97456.1 hypothetical protein [Candidatus Omnitrophota bacterium]HCI45162.1 hypothetical protein [Candidatus Omnitrophota bacterium]
METFVKALNTVEKEFDKLSKTPQSESLMRFASLLGELEGGLRELVQRMTKKEILIIIDKLKGGEELTTGEDALLKLWIVGDAEHYSKLENNYEDWANELKRLVNGICSLKGKELDIDLAMHLRALIYDATRVMDDLIYFTQHKERLERFIEVAEELDREERAHLVRILEQKLNSERF